MNLSDIVAVPLRWQPVREPIIRLLLMRERAQSGLALDPFDDDFRDNPYPLLRGLQEHDPVHWMATARGWLVTRYDDVYELLRDPRSSADRRPGMIDAVWRRKSLLQAWLENSLLGLDPPDHTRLRNLVNRAFTPRVVEPMRARIEAITDELLDGAASKGFIDIMKDLAEPLPVRVIAELLGVPREDQALFAKWSRQLSGGLDIAFRKEVIDEADRAVADLKDYFRPLLEARRREPREDLLTRLVQAEEAGDKLSEEELYSFCIILLAAGHETTTSLIGNGMLALLNNREELTRLATQPELAETAVEELLRYDPPPQATTRRALANFELQGKRIKAGDLVVLSIAAANRDPSQFKDPDRLDIGRSENRHLTFGQGPHYCIGAPLARLEAQIAFVHLVSRFPNLRFAAGESYERRNTLTVRSLLSLPALLE